MTDPNGSRWGRPSKLDSLREFKGGTRERISFGVLEFLSPVVAIVAFVLIVLGGVVGAFALMRLLID